MAPLVSMNMEVMRQGIHDAMDDVMARCGAGWVRARWVAWNPG
jgi:hypothetical protein